MSTLKWCHPCEKHFQPKSQRLKPSQAHDSGQIETLLAEFLGVFLAAGLWPLFQEHLRWRHRWGLGSNRGAGRLDVAWDLWASRICGFVCTWSDIYCTYIIIHIPDLCAGRMVESDAWLIRSHTQIWVCRSPSKHITKHKMSNIFFRPL